MKTRLAACRAAEHRTVDEEIANFPLYKRHASVTLVRLGRVAPLPERPCVLDLGSGAGGYLAAFSRLGCECFGVEPYGRARKSAQMVSERLGIPLRIAEGTAEQIPFEDEMFDIVHANSVMEHVQDLPRSILEIYRVLKPGGIFWFYTASALCPMQGEIRGFPLFGWYPDSLKRKIMEWAKEHRPQLVGYTSTPAVHWFTPWKTRRRLQKHGFGYVYDRWHLRGEDEGGKAHMAAIRLIRCCTLTKFLADALRPGCPYAAVKPGDDKQNSAPVPMNTFNRSESRPDDYGG